MATHERLPHSCMHHVESRALMTESGVAHPPSIVPSDTKGGVQFLSRPDVDQVPIRRGASLRSVRARIPTPYLEEEFAKLGDTDGRHGESAGEQAVRFQDVHQKWMISMRLPMRSARGRIPTPCAEELRALRCQSQVHFFVGQMPSQFRSVVEGGDSEDTAASSPPARRFRARLPTPFASATHTVAVQFGLTAQLAPPVSFGILEQSALRREALDERVPTPRAQTNAGEEPWINMEGVAVDRRAFEDTIEMRTCSGSEECAICHDSLGAQEAKMFPCGHFFHEGCILTWFEKQLTCPLCRRSFIPELGKPPEDPPIGSLSGPMLLQRSLSV
mmetsp:Transcript_64791/g.180324  ORF Transcript_64791/g.180324 Transcript_64791/m.180324 type:complete len:331 (-) Transcript_64791:309-1301(-)